MGTKLVYGAALLFLAAIATASKNTVSSSQSTSSTPVEDAAGTSKLKRGVVDVGTKIWVGQGNVQQKLVSPGSSSTGANHNVESYIPQSSSGSSNPTSYLSSKNYERTSIPGNQNSGYIQPTPYSAQSFVNVDENYGNNGQIIFGTPAGSFGNTGSQKAVNSPQNHGSTNQGQNSAALTAFYSPQTKTSNTPNFSYQNAQSNVGLPRTQNIQSGQIQNGGIGTPYYASFSNAPSPLKFYAEKLPSASYSADPTQATYAQRDANQKTQSGYTSENLQPASYVVSNIGSSYPYQQTANLNQGFPFASQQNPVFAATSQSQRNAPKNNYPKVEQAGAEFAQMYAPYHQSASSFVPSFQGGGLNAATVDFNGKKIPVPVLQLQSAENFPEFTQALQNQPLILESASPFQAQPDFSFLADFTKSLTPQSAPLLPFLNPQQQSNQPQVLPVRSANGSPQFPQYKGASLNTFPGFNQAKPAGAYEPLNTQPQLHFNRKPVAVAPAAPLPTPTASIIHHPSVNVRPLSENRDDVEIIKKKKPAPPSPHDLDEDDVDEGYKAIEREYGRNQEDDEDDHGKNYRDSDSGSDFKPSKSFPFKLYDEKFSKYSKPSSDDDSEDDRPSSRYQHQSSNEDDEDYDGHSSTHHADYKSPKPRPSRYEDGEEETQRYERQEEVEKDEEQDRRPATYSSYGTDFEQEFEDGYRRELPKNKYVHRKEVPEIDEPSTKSYSSSKGRQGYHQSHDEEPAESSNYDGHTSQKYRKIPKNVDKEDYSSQIRSYNKSPRVVHEESYGYKKPESENYSKYKKNPSGDSYSSVKKSPKMDSYLQASRSSYKSPKNDKAFEKGDSYSYSTGSSWKSDKKTPETSDHDGYASTAVKTLIQPDTKLFSFAPMNSRGNFVRDLTGI